MRSERTATIEEDEDHSRTGNCDHRQGGKVGDQVNVKAHGVAALSEIVTLPGYGALSRVRRIGSDLCDGLSQLQS